MTRIVAGAVVAVILGLACSACGSAVRPLRVVHQLPLTHIGTGSQSFGTFAIHGNVRVRATCVVTGKIKVTVTGPGGLGIGPVPCQGNEKVALDVEAFNGKRRSAHGKITVQAPAHTKWWVDVVDRLPNVATSARR